MNHWDLVARDLPRQEELTPTMRDYTFTCSRLLLVTIICRSFIPVRVTSHFGSRNLSQLAELDYLPHIYNKSIAKAHQRIAGGYTAREGEFPSFVSLIGWAGDKGSGCSGVAISELLVLTAAHCFKDNYKVTASPTIWQQSLWKAKGVKIYEVEKSCGKGKYNPTGAGRLPTYDYQMFRLKRPIKGIKFALLPGDQVPIGYHGVATGVGTVDNTGGIITSTKSLQALPVERLPCHKHEHPSRVCFQSYQDNHVGNICAGDSGGPVYGKTKEGRQVVLGLSSYAEVTCRKGIRRDFICANIFTEAQSILETAKRCLKK